MNTRNANFHYFKSSGKYYTDARGKVPDSFATWSREELIACNEGLMPGLMTEGNSFIVVVIPDDGWPQLKFPPGVDTLPKIG